LLDTKNTLSLYYESVAKTLKSNGFKVTVIFMGQNSQQFSTVASFYKNQGINVEL